MELEDDDYRGPSGALSSFLYVLAIYALAGLLCWACSRMTADAATGAILAPARSGEAYRADAHESRSLLPQDCPLQKVSA